MAPHTVVRSAGRVCSLHHVRRDSLRVPGRAKVQWGKLTNDDLDVIAGRREVMSGKIQERYGIAKDEAEKQLKAWQGKADDSWFA